MRIEYAITLGKDGATITHRVISGGEDDGGAPVPIGVDPGGAPVPIGVDPGGGMTVDCGCGTVIVLGPTIITGGGGRCGSAGANGTLRPLTMPVEVESVPNRPADKFEESVSDNATGDIISGATMRGQEQWYWCWAAVGSAVRKIVDSSDMPQCEVADLVMTRENPGLPSSCEDPGPSNIPKSLAATLSLLDNLQSPSIGFVPTFPLIKRETAAGRPIAARIAWDTYGRGVEEGAHFVLIAGWETVDGVDKVKILDPAAGMTDPGKPGKTRAIPTIEPRSIPYREFREAYIGTGRWVSSYFVKEMDK